MVVLQVLHEQTSPVKTAPEGVTFLCTSAKSATNSQPSTPGSATNAVRSLSVGFQEGSFFRPDLNFEDQRSALKTDKDRVRRAALIAQWERTTASRNDHRHMLRALVTESALFRRRNGSHLPSSTLRDLCDEIDHGMCRGVDDPYVGVLAEVAALRLFHVGLTTSK